MPLLSSKLHKAFLSKDKIQSPYSGLDDLNNFAPSLAQHTHLASPILLWAYLFPSFFTPYSPFPYLLSLVYVTNASTSVPLYLFVLMTGSSISFPFFHSLHVFLFGTDTMVNTHKIATLGPWNSLSLLSNFIFSVTFITLWHSIYIFLYDTVYIFLIYCFVFSN